MSPPQGDGNGGAVRAALDQLRAHQEALADADEEMRVQLESLTSATERAHREADHYRALFEAAPDAYFVTDRFAVIREANGAAAALLERDSRWLAGKSLVALVHAGDVRIVREGLETLRDGDDKDLSFIVRFRCRSGETTMRHVRGIAIDDGVSMLWIARAPCEKDDVARTEIELRKELDAGHVAKDRFLAVHSQDMRAPINAVLSWTQLLRREGLEPAARVRALETIQRSARAQALLVEELLSISRMMADKVALERCSVDLGDVIEGVVEKLLSKALAGGVDLELLTSGGRCVVSGDLRWLERMLTCLVSNALKFTPRNGNVNVWLGRKGTNACVIVRDTGRGIAQELLPFVFDPFRQSPRGVADADEGLGLGLFLVKQAVEMHGGRITADSQGRDRGARFDVSLPLE